MREAIVEYEVKGDMKIYSRNTGELIRCKDCKYRIDSNCNRFGAKRYTQANSFCSWAERKEE